VSLGDALRAVPCVIALKETMLASKLTASSLTQLIVRLSTLLPGTRNEAGSEPPSDHAYSSENDRVRSAVEAALNVHVYGAAVPLAVAEPTPALSQKTD
jgi:hypothetical protein